MAPTLAPHRPRAYDSRILGPDEVVAMKATPTMGERRLWTVTAGLLILASLLATELRLGAWIPNVTAVGALALYAGGRMRWWLAWLPPLAVMAVTDLLLERWYGYSSFNK